MSDLLRGIREFVAVVDAGSFAAAAARLNLSRSAVGKAVARLEARLGVRLCHRTTRALGLTEDGQAFYERCTRALREIEDAELVRVLDDLPACELTNSALWPRTPFLPSRVRFLIDALATRLREMMGLSLTLNAFVAWIAPVKVLPLLCASTWCDRCAEPVAGASWPSIQ